MIVHNLGTETVTGWGWLDDDDEPVEPGGASLLVFDRDGAAVTELAYTLESVGTGLAVDEEAGGVTLTLPADLDLEPGNYEYRLVVIDPGDDSSTLLAAGLLRVRGQQTGE